eukprot:4867316-Pyramimonas_sp.AAC.3
MTTSTAAHTFAVPFAAGAASLRKNKKPPSEGGKRNGKKRHSPVRSGWRIVLRRSYPTAARALGAPCCHSE